MAKEIKPSWIKTSSEEVGKIVIKLAKEGHQPEKIGLILRDQYGIPTTKVFGIKVSKILKENKMMIDSDIKNIDKKTYNIKSHLEKNKHDYTAKKALSKKIAKINKLEKYRKKKAK